MSSIEASIVEALEWFTNGDDGDPARVGAFVERILAVMQPAEGIILTGEERGAIMLAAESMRVLMPVNAARLRGLAARTAGKS